MHTNVSWKSITQSPTTLLKPQEQEKHSQQQSFNIHNSLNITTHRTKRNYVYTFKASLINHHKIKRRKQDQASNTKIKLSFPYLEILLKCSTNVLPCSHVDPHSWDLLPTINTVLTQFLKVLKFSCWQPHKINLVPLTFQP